MNSQINQTMIEGLLSVGLGRKPEVHWEPFNSELEPVLQALAECRVALPQLKGNESELLLLSRTGLGMLATKVADAQEFAAVWPESGMQRLATVAMELGAVAAKIVSDFFFCERYLQSFVEELEFGLLVARCESTERGESQESPLNLVFFMAMHHALTRANLATGDLARTVNGVLDAYRSDVACQALLRPLDSCLADCVGSEDYAVLSRMLFPKAGGGSDASSEQQSSAEDHQSQAGGDSLPGKNEQEAERSGDQVQGSSNSGHQTPSEGGAACSSSFCGDAAISVPQAVIEHESDTEVGHMPVGQSQGDTAAEGQASGQISGHLQDGQKQECNGQLPELPDSNSLGLSPQSDAPIAFESEGEVQGIVKMPAGEPSSEQTDSTSWCFVGGDGLTAERTDSVQSEKVSDARLVATLLRVFQDKKPKSNGYVAAGPRIAAHRMWRLKRLGDVAVFRKPIARCGIDISVQILLDTSGSMSHDLQCASNVTIALAEAMARTSGAKCALSVFPASGAYTQEILGFGGQVALARREIRRIRACGGTPMGEAMAEVIPRLGRERSLRKLLLVITDGSPGNSAKVRDQVSVADSMGIEVVGIGIGEGLGSVLRNLIPKSASVTSVTQLAPALERVFRGDLL